MTDQECLYELQAKYDALHDQRHKEARALDSAHAQLAALESRLAIYDGWTPEDAETKEALEWAEASPRKPGSAYKSRNEPFPNVTALRVLARALRAAMGNLKKMEEQRRESNGWKKPLGLAKMPCEICGQIEVHLQEAHKYFHSGIKFWADRAEKAEAGLEAANKVNQALDKDLGDRTHDLAKAEAANKELEAKLEGARQLAYEEAEALKRTPEGMADERTAGKVYAYEAVARRLGQPSPLPALREKVVEAARDFSEQHRMIRSECDCSVCKSILELDAAEAKERG